MPETQSAALKDLAPHHLPPQNVEAEESVICAVLIDNTTLSEIMELLTPEDFYRSRHQKIFAGIAALFNDGEPVDLITLANILKSRGDLDKVGGAAYLVHLMDTVPAAINPEHYARIIRDKARLRRLIGAANSIIHQCFEEKTSIEDTLDAAEAAIFKISQHGGKPVFSHISKLIETNIDTLEERQGNQALYTGIPTGFSRLDFLTSGLQRSDLVILAARPSMGKTALALNIVRNVAIDSQVPCAVFSLEMASKQLSLRLLCSEARIDSSRLRSGFFSEDDWHQLTDAAGRLVGAPIFIDDAGDISAMSIRAKARRLKAEHGLGLVVVDYVQLMKSSLAAERRDLEISEISRSLKSLAKELDVPVLALSQLNRKLEERSDKRPQLSDLRESGALEQDADLVAFIYRDEVYNRDENNPHRGKADIILAKHRNGPTGVATLAFLNAYTRFENLAEEAMDYR